MTAGTDVGAEVVDPQTNDTDSAQEGAVQQDPVTSDGASTPKTTSEPTTATDENNSKHAFVIGLDIL